MIKFLKIFWSLVEIFERKELNFLESFREEVSKTEKFESFGFDNLDLNQTLILFILENLLKHSEYDFENVATHVSNLIVYLNKTETGVQYAFLEPSLLSKIGIS